MSSTQSTTERLVAARPLVADHLDELVAADERARLFDQILAADTTEVDPVPYGRRTLPRGRVVAAVAGAAAVVAAAVTLAALTWTGHSPGGAKPMASRSATVLLAHVTTALAGVNDDVVVIDGTNNGVRSTFWALTQGGGATHWRYSVNGKPNYDQTISTVNGRRTMTNVDFAARTWWTAVSLPVKGDPCGFAFGRTARAAVATTAPQASGRPDGGASSCSVFGPTPAQIVQSLNAGEFTITGHPVLDGRPTIEITAKYPTASGTYRLFVDASSYLPVMSINSINTPPTTYSYLPATPANMKLLQVPIPAGFRHADQPILCNPSQLKPHETIFGCP